MMIGWKESKRIGIDESMIESITPCNELILLIRYKDGSSDFVNKITIE